MRENNGLKYSFPMVDPFLANSSFFYAKFPSPPYKFLSFFPHPFPNKFKIQIPFLVFYHKTKNIICFDYSKPFAGGDKKLHRQRLPERDTQKLVDPWRRINISILPFSSFSLPSLTLNPHSSLVILFLHFFILFFLFYF